MGATATDHAAVTPYTARAVARRRRRRSSSAPWRAEPRPTTLVAFTGHMLMEMARMSVDDGLVMQLHPGSLRNHNPRSSSASGPIAAATSRWRPSTRATCSRCSTPTATTRGFTLVLFTLDETTYSRELAPLAGHYPAVAPRPAVVVPRQPRRHEALPPSGDRDRRHLQHRRLQRRHARVPVDPGAPRRRRRVDANFLADQVSRHVITLDDAREMIGALTYELVKKTYRLERETCWVPSAGARVLRCEVPSARSAEC